MAYGIGGGGFMGIAHESVMGTYVAPTVFVPFLTEGLTYNTDNYVSPAIRQSAAISDAKQSYYHAEGDVQWEVDNRLLPYFLHAMRLTIVKTGAGPYTYTCTPAAGASSGIGAGNATAKTLSITLVRNGRVFKYVGCVVPHYTFTVEDGVLKSTMSVMGLGETGLAGDTPPTPTWVAQSLLGAAVHNVYMDAAGTAPAFATPSVIFNGITVDVNDNGAAQNRIRSNRQAAFISFGEQVVTLSSQFDFVDGTEYDNYVATNTRAYRLKSENNVTTDSFQFTGFRGFYNSYPVALPGLGELVMADSEVRFMNIVGGSIFEIICKSTTSIT